MSCDTHDIYGFPGKEKEKEKEKKKEREKKMDEIHTLSNLRWRIGSVGIDSQRY